MTSIIQLLTYVAVDRVRISTVHQNKAQTKLLQAMGATINNGYITTEPPP